MPRKSEAELSIVSPFPKEERRPEPAMELNPTEAEVWAQVVSAMPATWFARKITPCSSNTRATWCVPTTSPR